MKLTEKQQHEIELAQQEINNHQPHQAVKRLAPIDEEVDDQHLRYIYAQALVADQQYTKAWRLIEDDRAAYFNDQEHQLFYLDVMLKNQLFISARLFANQLGDNRLIAIVSKAEEHATQTESATINARENNFYHLGDRPFRGQQERFEEAAKLPLANYLNAAKFVIRDPYVHPLLRSSVIQDLANLKVNEEMTFYWIDEQEHTVNPGKLLPLDQIPVVIRMMRRLQDNYAQSNPMSYQSFVQQFHLQLILLYPRIEETITDGDAWFQVLTAYSRTDNTSRIKLAYDWQAKLMRIIQRLM